MTDDHSPDHGAPRREPPDEGSPGAPNPHPGDPRVGMVIGGRYELLHQIGAGGVGQVFAAHDRRLDRRVAIKLVSAMQARTADPSATQRFVTEARSGATFSHRHAVTVFDAGISDDHLYLVTELVEGTTLAERLARRGALDPVEAARITDQLLQALHAAHAAGIVHRDVKPSNVLLDRHGNVKLADFGIAKRLDDVQGSLTATGFFMGTPSYAAPEQSAGEQATPATDIYAVGGVLYEMLTGVPPYQADTSLAVVLAHRDAPVPDPRAHRPGVPHGIAGITQRALAKSPTDRFDDAAQMRRALAQAATADASPLAGSGDAAAETVMAASPGETVAGEVIPLSGGQTPSESRRGIPWWWWVAVAAVVAIGIGALLAFLDRNGSSGSGGEEDGATGGTAAMTAAPAATSTTATPATTLPTVPATNPPTTTATTHAPTTTAPTTAPPTTAPPTTPPPPPPTPTDLGSLIGTLETMLASDPDAAGRRGEHMLRELRRVAERDGPNQLRAAERAEDRIDDWVGDDQITQPLGDIALRILEDLVDRLDDEFD